MNTTTLKSVFKAVYGMPIASYMKEYRMKLASNMLLQKDKSISEIAAAVGYKSQSKFTSAFRDIFQILPTAYQEQVSYTNAREFDTLKSKKVPQSLEIGLFFCQIFIFII